MDADVFCRRIRDFRRLNMKVLKRTDRVDLQVSILTFLIVVVSCTCVFLLNYNLSYRAMLDDLETRARSIHSFLETRIDDEIVAGINSEGDMGSDIYRSTKEMLEAVRVSAGVRYLYTAKLADDGSYIYQVDGLPSDSADFRNAGDLIEQEIIPDIQRAHAGETVLPDTIKDTSWGYIYISYFPIHEGERVIGVVGIEFDAEQHYNTYRVLRIATPVIIAVFCCIASLIAVVLFRRISNPGYRDFANTDMLTGLANRNAFDVMVHNIEAMNRQGGIGFISIDFDGLKTINDTHGHGIGDCYIRDGSEILAGCIRDSDVLYRVGGDELAIMLIDNELDEISSIMQRIETHLSEHNKQAQIPISFSMGCARFDPEQDSSLHDTLRRADKRMYQEKREKKEGGCEMRPAID